MKIPPFLSDWVAIGCVIHACCITAFWILVFEFDVDPPITGRSWMLLAFSWLAWWVVIASSRSEVRRNRAIAGLIGILILAPTISTVYSFLVWAVAGFAP
jgi:hypothetical protein